MDHAALATNRLCLSGVSKPLDHHHHHHHHAALLLPHKSSIKLFPRQKLGGLGCSCRWAEEKNKTSQRRSIHQRKNPFVCRSVLAEKPIDIPDCLDADDSPFCKLRALVSEFESLHEPLDRVKRLLHYGSSLPGFPEADKVMGNRVMGCTAQVWLAVRMDGKGRMRFSADSDSEITRGFCAALIRVLDGALPEEVLRLRTEDLGSLNVGVNGNANSRVNTWHNVLVSMQKKTKAILALREGRPPGDPFPSLIVNRNGIQAKGSYAEAQAKFLLPDQSRVNELVNVLKAKKIGVVAHFYMDPEVQGVLTAAKKHWPHIYISDSLIMADAAVKMAKEGCKFITVLGVDFMSENVRAILDEAGYEKVGVFRMSEERIGCSLADAASSPSYMRYLEEASTSSPSLHVIYINTSLQTKAQSHELVPTITCTSSNVVQTVLQAFTQIPDLTVWYGPDSYMGANLAKLFHQMSMMTDEEISHIHSKHNRSSIKSLLPRLKYYQDGSCIVHEIFGHDVVERIREDYCDAFLTAHLEVPGEMFSLAMEAKRRGMGVVGSTQNILDFITQRVEEAVRRNVDDHLQFVLGTESGMITSIVAAVSAILSSTASSDGSAVVDVEVVFPVSSDSISTITTHSNGLNSTENDSLHLNVVPGVMAGEGCSIHGGCASCPYMKMNSLSSLLRICKLLPDNGKIVSLHEASRYNELLSSGKSIAELGCEPILHMRHFQKNKELPGKLVNQILHPS